MKTNGDAVRPMKQHSNEECPLLLILLILILIWFLYLKIDGK